MDQAYTNFTETFPFFVANRHDSLTAWGAHLYFWGRAVYVVAAVAGFGLVRSMICFNTALAGIALFVIALLR